MNFITKLCTSFIAVLIGVNAYADDEKLELTSYCGVDTETREIIPFDFTICPSDKTLSAMYTIFPTLVKKSVILADLDYADEIIKELTQDGTVIEDRSIEDSSFYFTDMIKKIVMIFAAFSVGGIIWSYTIANKQEQLKSLNVPATIMFFSIGGVLLVEFEGFYGIQWLFMFCALAGLSAANFTMSMFAYFLQFNFTTSLTETPDMKLYTSKAEADFITSQEIDTAICTLQLVTQDYYRTRRAIFFDTPVITHLGASKDGDDFNTSIEVQQDGSDMIASYGSGTASSGFFGFFDGLGDSITGRNPQTCAKEKSMTDKEVGGVLERLEDDYSNVSELFYEFVKGELDVDKIEVADASEVEAYAALSRRFHSGIIGKYRNPLIIEDARVEAYNKSLLIAQKIRQLSCLEDSANIIRTDNTLTALFGSNHDGDGSLACASRIKYGGMDGFEILENASLMFEREDMRVKGAVKAKQEQLNLEIAKLTDELRAYHQGNLENIYESYLQSRRVPVSKGIEESIYDLRQGGVMNYSANLAYLFIFADTYLHANGSYESINPQFVVQALNQTYLPDVEPTTVMVGDIVSGVGEWSRSRDTKYSPRDLENALLQGKKAVVEKSVMTDRIKDDTQNEVWGMFLDSFDGLSAKLGVGVDMGTFEDSNFEQRAIEGKWTATQMTSNFLTYCFSGREMSLFNDGMIRHCEKLRRHPIATVRELGVGMFEVGADLFENIIAASVITKVTTLKTNTFDVDMGGVSSSSRIENLKKAGKYAANATEKAFSLAEMIVSFMQSAVLGLSICLMLVGSVLGYMIPVMPALSALAIGTYWFLTVIVVVCAGSVFAIQMFKARVFGDEREQMDGALTKKILMITLRPMVIVVSLSIVWVLMDVMFKVAMLVVNVFSQNLMTSSANGVSYAIIGLFAMFGAVYLYVKILIHCYQKLNEITVKVTQMINVGAQISSNATSSRVENIVAMAVGAKVITGSMQVAKHVVQEEKRVLEQVRLQMQKRSGWSDDTPEPKKPLSTLSAKEVEGVINPSKNRGGSTPKD